MDLMFGMGRSTGNDLQQKTPHETAVDVPPEETAAEEQEAEEEMKGVEDEGAAEDGLGSPELAVAVRPTVWNSNIKSWFGAWKEGGAIQVRYLDDLAAVGRGGVIIQGQVWKKGGRVNDAFLSRWVTVDAENISYSVAEGEAVLDRIAFADVIAVCYYKAPTSYIPDSDDATVNTPGAPPGEEDNDKVKEENAHQMPVEDDALGFNAAANLHVNTTFRDEIYEVEIASLQELTLSASDFALVTSKESYQEGRVFIFRAESKESAESWSETLSRVLVSYACVPVTRVTRFNRLRRGVRWFYVGDRCQVFVAMLILSNFIANIFEAHFTPEPGSDMQGFFGKVDTGVLYVVYCVLCDCGCGYGQWCVVCGDLWGGGWVCVYIHVYIYIYICIMYIYIHIGMYVCLHKIVSVHTYIYIYICIYMYI